MARARRAANGQGLPYQRGSDGRWCCSVTLGHNPDTGKPIRKTVYGRTSAEAAKKRAELLAELASPSPKREEVTVRQLMEEFLLLRRREWKPRTYNSAESVVRLHILPLLGDVKLSRLDTRRVSQWLQKSPQSRSMQLARTYLLSACTLAMQWDWLERNPVALAPTVRTTPRKPLETSVEQVQAILKATEGSRYHIAVVLMLGCGLRISEALGLVWGDWNEVEGLLSIEYQIGTDTGAYKGKPLRVPLKTKSSRRSVGVPAFVAEALRAHRKAQQAEIEQESVRGGVWGNPWGLVVTRAGGTPSRRHDAHQSIGNHLAAAGIEGVTLHDMRHAFASLLIDARLPITVISDALGHRDANITLGVYAHKLAQRGNLTATALDALMGREEH